MHVVVNHLTMSEPATDAAIQALQDDALPRIAEIPGALGAFLVRETDTDWMMLVLGDSADTMGRISSEVGSAWVMKYLAPTFTAPPRRTVGEVAGGGWVRDPRDPG